MTVKINYRKWTIELLGSLHSLHLVLKDKWLQPERNDVEKYFEVPDSHCLAFETTRFSQSDYGCKLCRNGVSKGIMLLHFQQFQFVHKDLTFWVKEQQAYKSAIKETDIFKMFFLNPRFNLSNKSIVTELNYIFSRIFVFRHELILKEQSFKTFGRTRGTPIARHFYGIPIFIRNGRGVPNPFLQSFCASNTF